MLKNTNLIAFTGSAGSGKNTAADYVKDFWALPSENVVLLSFAEPIKTIAKILFGWDFEDPDFDKDVPCEKTGIVPRHFLQDFGTEYIRHKWKDSLWVDILERKLSEATDALYVITDLRFDNEAEMIKRRGGKIFQVVRGESIARKHVSENGIDPKYIDEVITNNGSLEDLRRQVEAEINFLLD